MLPVYPVDGGWMHDLSDELFDERDDAVKDYRRCLLEKKACPAGGCDD